MRESGWRSVSSTRRRDQQLPQSPEKTRKTGQPSAVRPVRHITGRTPHPRASAGGDRPIRGQRFPRMRKGQATEFVRIRSCRVAKSEAGGRSTRHASPGIPVRRAATSGDRGALGGDVSRLWYSGCQHPTCTFMPPCSCLLYTSPSPRDRQKSRMPSSA